MHIRILRSVIIFAFLLSCFSGQTQVSSQNTFTGNFYLQKYIRDFGDSDTPVGIFIKGDKEQIVSFVAKENGLYRGSVKGWHYIRIPSSSLKDLLISNSVQEINFRPYKGEAMNDTMRVNNRINDVHAGTAPLDVPYTGKNVVLGFIDTGIDWHHPDFMNPDSSTRILSIWDQTLANNQYTPSAYGYGQHWDSTLINQDIPTNHDQWGHGSTVAGAAAGNAFANGKNKGVAPDADIIMVESNFNAVDWLATVVDAVEYIYHIADSLGKPCSINASVGTYLGSHDGLDPYALYIDSLINAKRGHLFAASAGNSGNIGSYHLHHNVTPDTNYTFFEVNPSAATGDTAVFFEFWADSADFNQVYFTMGADKVSPSHSFRGRGQFINIQNNLNTLLLDTIRNSNNDILGTIQYWMEPRDAQYFVQVYMPTPDSNQYMFRLEAFGNGSFDAWNTSIFGLSDMLEFPNTIPGFTDFAHYISPDSLQTIVSSFQCSPNVIAVGNYANDSGYVNKYGGWTAAPGEVRGKLASTSSIGPARTGIMKPEVAASGTVTNSTYPLYYIDYLVTNNLDTTLALGGMHYRNGGTSMASPIVAGVGALYLEKCPNATQQDFIKALINNTYTDAFTGTTPNYAYGYGKLDGFATMVDARFTASYNGNLSICQGDSSLITITGSNSNYWWSNGDTTSAVYLADSNTTFFTTMDSTGCMSDTMYINMEVFNPAVLNLMNPYEYCQTDSVSLLLTGNFSSLLYSDGNTDNPRIFSNPFDGWVISTDTNNCNSDTTAVTIIERPLPPAIVSVNGAQLSTYGGVYYEWYFSDGTLASAGSDSTYTVLTNDSYYVVVYNTYSCSSTSDTTVFNSVGINESELFSISVYPNPSYGYVTIETSERSSIYLYDNLGKLVYSGKNNSSYQLNNLSQGSYLLKVSNGTRFEVGKIIVLK